MKLFLKIVLLVIFSHTVIVQLKQFRKYYSSKKDLSLFLPQKYVQALNENLALLFIFPHKYTNKYVCGMHNFTQYQLYNNHKIVVRRI